MLSAITGGLAPSGKRPGDVKILLFLVSPDANAEGGTVYVTFQIAWSIFKEIHNNKK